MKTAVLALLWTLVSLVSTVQGGKMFGLCYTPFRVFGACPTDAEVEADVQILLRHTSRVRVYSTECINVNKILLRHASQGDLSVLLGVYLDNRPTDQQEVDYLIEALSEYPHANIAGIVVGNEVLYRGTLPKSTLLGRVQEVREKVRGLGMQTGSESLKTTPIFAVEMFPDQEVAAASDTMGLNIHPFYRPDLEDIDDPDIMSDRILEAAIESIDLYRNMMPGKPILVTEIGWPTQSDPTEMHRGDPVTALKFMHKFTAYCEANSIFYYWFEAFDSPWKKPMFPTNGATMSEFNFGLYYADRVTPKELPDECTYGCAHQPPPPVEYHTEEPAFDFEHEEPVADPFQETQDFSQVDSFGQETPTAFAESNALAVASPGGEAYAESYAVAEVSPAETNVISQASPEPVSDGHTFSLWSNPYRRLLRSGWARI